MNKEMKNQINEMTPSQLLTFRKKVSKSYDLLFDKILKAKKGSKEHIELLKEEARLNKISQHLNSKFPTYLKILVSKRNKKYGFKN
jgi:pheromone shutdown protein TraB